MEAHDVDELCEMIYAGKIQDSKTVSAILAYKNLLNKDSGKHRLLVRLIFGRKL